MRSLFQKEKQSVCLTLAFKMRADETVENWITDRIQSCSPRIPKHQQKI